MFSKARKFLKEQQNNSSDTKQSKLKCVLLPFHVLHVKKLQMQVKNMALVSAGY